MRTKRSKIRIREHLGFCLVEFRTPRGWGVIHGARSNTPSIFPTRNEADEFVDGCRAGRDPASYLDDFDHDA